MKRRTPDDTEWFNLGHDALEMVTRCMESKPWAKPAQLLDDVPHVNVGKPVRPNTDYLPSKDERIVTLTQLQRPVVAKTVAFFNDPLIRAGIIVAPCGSGKTRMTCTALQVVKKRILCAPLQQVQEQWVEQIGGDVLVVGGAGTTKVDDIVQYLKNDAFTIVTTYMSSHLVEAALREYPVPDVLTVFDEAHHMAGVVTEAEGRTRQLLQLLVETKGKRLFLTFTPRNVTSDEDVTFSMDDTEVFGEIIAELKYDTLMKLGVLPKPRLWKISDDHGVGTGKEAKAACVLHAWKTMDNVAVGFDDRGGVRKEWRHRINHLIIFAATREEAAYYMTYYTLHAEGTLVLHAQDGAKVHDQLEEFSAAPRAIIINCKILNEGVNIPVADSVAIMYPKHMIGETTQMILRAGRDYENKPMFFILIPVLDPDEDYKALLYVLKTLAACSEQLLDDIVHRVVVGGGGGGGSGTVKPMTSAEWIVDELVDGLDADALDRLFQEIYAKNELKKIRAICRAEHVDNSAQYEKVREHRDDLPSREDVKARLLHQKEWFDFLNVNVAKVPLDDFKKEMAQLEVYSIALFEARKMSHWPSVQNVNDGYFKGIHNIAELFPKPKR
jgi:superfamily II DNA or RNA helicase